MVIDLTTAEAEALAFGSPLELECLPNGVMMIKPAKVEQVVIEFELSSPCVTAVTVTPASAPYPGAEVHRWSVVTKLQDPNGCEAAEADAAVRAAMAPLVGRDDWEYASGRAGERWSKRYDYAAEAWRWHAEVRRV